MIEKQIVNRIQSAIDYIEEHLCEKIEVEKVAQASLMSKSSFYVIFSSILSTTVKDYIRKRRLSLSAYDLVKTDLSILDLALQYQYCTYESYSRAFKKLFGISPNKYREKNLYINVFPRVSLAYNNLIGGDRMINREMNKTLILEKIKMFSNGYILDIDIDHFAQINKRYGYNIGDKVLIEIPKRIKMVLANHKIDVDVIRINNDEFAVILKNQSISFIEKLSEDIISAMSHEFLFDDLSIHVSVSIGISDFTVGCNNEEIIKNVKNAMLQAKKNGRNQYKILD